MSAINRKTGGNNARFDDERTTADKKYRAACGSPTWEAEIVSITAQNDYHKYTYGECLSRARRVSNLSDLNVSDGAAIGTLAWNDYRHLELYYGVSCPAKYYTRLTQDYSKKLIYIVNHAKDEVLFFDSMFAGLVEKFAMSSERPSFVELTEKDSPSDVKIKNLAPTKC